MAAPSGTVLLCDQVYQAQGGKFVIAGTYTTIEVHCRDLRNADHQINGLNLYLRLRPERLGPLTCQILVRDEAQPPWSEPLMQTTWEVRVTERNIRLVEMTMVSPPFVVHARLPPDVQADAVLLRYGIEFRVDGEVVASTPLDVRFVLEKPTAPPA